MKRVTGSLKIVEVSSMTGETVADERIVPVELEDF